MAGSRRRLSCNFPALMRTFFPLRRAMSLSRNALISTLSSAKAWAAGFAGTDEGGWELPFISPRIAPPPRLVKRGGSPAQRRMFFRGFQEMGRRCVVASAWPVEIGDEDHAHISLSSGVASGGGELQMVGREIRVGL